jgi:transposase
MANHTQGPKRRYPPELRERAVRMYFETADRAGEQHGVVTRVAQQLGIGAESLRNWVRQAEVDRGERRGTGSDDAERIAALERELRELRRANEILKSASLFFATELDGRRPR